MSAGDMIMGGLLVGFLVAFAFVGKIALDRYMNRGKVWFMLSLRKGGVKLKRVRVGPEGETKTNHGTFFALGEADEGPYKAKWDEVRQFFRFKEGNPFPYRYGDKIVRPLTREAANGGEELGVPIYERFDEAVHIPSRAIKTYLDQHDFRDAYSGQFKLMILFFILLAVILLAVFGLYAR
jgi:hypothetical protein